MVRKLEAAGLVSRTPAAEDARAIVVGLTGKGQDMIPRLKELWQELAEETLGGLTSTPADQLIAALTDLARGLQAGASSSGAQQRS